MKNNAIKIQDDAAMKGMLYQIGPMLTPMAMKFDGVAEVEHEYEHEYDGADALAQSDARERRSHVF